MWRKTKEQKRKEEEFVDNIIHLIRFKATNNDDVEKHYKIFKEFTPYQSKYFKQRLFDEVPYSETKKKMLALMKSDISMRSFEGKDFLEKKS